VTSGVQGVALFTEGGCSRLAGSRGDTIVHMYRVLQCLQRNVGTVGLESVVTSGVQGVAVFTVHSVYKRCTGCCSV